jgi:hypothetical protein
MAKNAWGRFPERGKWQKMRGDDFLSVGNGKKYILHGFLIWKVAKINNK